MASQRQKQLHFVLIPLMTQGHLIPMVDIARLLAQRIVMVTIVTTPLNAARFNSIIQRDIESGLTMQVLQLQFPHAQVGLPEGCESLDTLPSPYLITNFMNALSLLQNPLETLFQELQPTPTCIVSDRDVLWAAETARKFRVPRISFDGTSCFARMCSYHLRMSNYVYESLPESEPFVVPGLPDRIQLAKAQLFGVFGTASNPYLGDIVEKIREDEGEEYGVVVNSFQELEADYVEGLKKITRGKVWCIGPVSLCNRDNLDKAQRGNKSSMDEKQCLKWLDTWPPGSVIYACLGSLNRLTPPQLAELGLGLEASKRPFIWVIRGAYRREEMEEWLEKNGFEERVKGKGLLIRGWAPQVLILSHPAIGGFLTHCGWNSTLEGICAGVPMMTWPIFAEQFYNEKFILQVLKIGVRVGAESVVLFGEEEKVGVLVKKNQVKEAIDLVMVEGKQGEERRLRAKLLAELANKAMDQGGSSNLDITLLLEDIMQQYS